MRLRYMWQVAYEIRPHQGRRSNFDKSLSIRKLKQQDYHNEVFYDKRKSKKNSSSFKLIKILREIKLFYTMKKPVFTLRFLSRIIYF